MRNDAGRRLPAGRHAAPAPAGSGRGRWQARAVSDPVVLLGAALAVKAIGLLQLGHHPLLQPHGDLDTARYVDLARQVASAGPLAVPEPFFLSPLYVYFLAAVFSIRDSLLLARIVQVLLGTAAVGFVFATARQWFDVRVARLAAVLALLTGLFTFSEILILQAALDPFLVAAALYFVSRTQFKSGAAPLLLAGATLGLFALNRPNALAYGLAAAVLIGLASRGPGPRDDRAVRLGVPLRRAALVLASLLAVLAANALRNYLASGEAILISSHGGLNFYIGNNAEAEGIYQRVPGISGSIAGQVHDATRVAEAAEGRPLSASEVSAHFYRQAWAWIAGHPADALILFGRKIATLLNRIDVPLNYSYAFYSRDESTVLRLLVVGPWLLVPLGLVGLLLGARTPEARRIAGATGSRLSYWTWASFVPIYGLSVAAFFVSDRYRMPLLVPLAILSAQALVWMADRLRARQFAELAAAVLAVMLAGAFVGQDLGLDDGMGGERARKTNALIQQGSYEEARAYASRAVEGLPYPGVFHFQVGEELAAAGRYEEAIDELQAALAIDRDQPAIHLTLGQALLLAGRADAAVPHLTEATDAAFRPEVSAPWLVRALAAAGRRGEAVEALAGLADAVVAAAGPATATEIGSLALDLQAPAPAERWLREAVRQAPDAANAQERLAVALLLQRRPAEALAPLERACRLAPSNASARLNLAVVYAELGRFDEARAAAQEAARLDPSEPRAAALLKALPAARQ